MGMKGDNRIRVDPKFKRLIKEVQIDFIRNNKKPPSATQITKALEKMLRKEDLRFDKFIRFKK